MDYKKITVQCSADIAEILLALFSTIPFDTFQENEHGFEAYMPIDSWNAEFLKEIRGYQERFSFDFATEIIKSQNWNAIWESNFEPIEVGDFCGIRAEFHPHFEGVKHEITIQPKMAFGTGHHETTYMVIQMMEGIDFKDKQVLDYGCGTGVLAILAGKLAARQLVAVDIEQPSYENTLENARKNNIPNIETVHGTLADIYHEEFDIILANINRNVILASLSTLSLKLKEEGQILISGILKEDEAILRTALETHNFVITELLERNKWICLRVRKKH